MVPDTSEGGAAARGHLRVVEWVDARVRGWYRRLSADRGLATLDGGREIHILFDGPPGPVAGRFVEVEAPEGRSIRVGEWREREDGYWALVLRATTPGEQS